MKTISWDQTVSVEEAGAREYRERCPSCSTQLTIVISKDGEPIDFPNEEESLAEGAPLS